MPSTNFDFCANEYSSIFELPHIKYGDDYTLMKKIGDVSGRSVMDVGCGEGTLARLLKSQGASRVVGLDLSERMVELAKQQENRQGSGVEYLCRDLLMLETIGQFDLVIASFIFTLAHTRDNLLKMCQAVHANLKPEGRLLVGQNQNPNPRTETVHYSAHLGAGRLIDQPMLDACVTFGAKIIEKTGLSNRLVGRITCS